MTSRARCSICQTELPTWDADCPQCDKIAGVSREADTTLRANQAVYNCRTRTLALWNDFQLILTISNVDEKTLDQELGDVDYIRTGEWIAPYPPQRSRLHAAIRYDA